jgi:tRNA-2-methylthio-N6-dimethylallyladenosine synthase
VTDDVSAEVKKSRFLRLDKVMRAFQKKSLDLLVNKTLEVLVEGKSMKDTNVLSGHTTCHRTVNFNGSEELLGKIVKVKIVESKVNTLVGEIC